MERKDRKIHLDKAIKSCHLCEGLNIPEVTESAPGYGDINSPVMIIGQSLCTACMNTQIPFTGGSGLLLDEIFDKVGVKKEHLFITNLVHCHPPDNRASKLEEITNCRNYIKEEIDIVNPLLIIGLGNDVKHNLFYHGANLMTTGVLYRCANGRYEGRHICFVYHPAYYYRLGGLKSERAKEYVSFMVDLLKRFI